MGRFPGAVVELLRLFVVAFFAGLGYQLAGVAHGQHAAALGGVDLLLVGVVLGSAVGYVLGGVLGRTTVKVVSQTESALREVSADQIVAGLFGALLGLVSGAVVSGPVLLVQRPLLSYPVVGFVTVALTLLGYRTGLAKRDGMLAIFGSRAGLAARPVATASLPRVLDTSVAIDGRILDVVRAGFLHGALLVPSPVLDELQGLADAADDLRRGRGRRGLDVLEALRRDPGVALQVIPDEAPGVPEVDAKLVRICLDRTASLLTLDTNLARAASLAGVRVMNLHALALALRPPVSAGDEVSVLLIKPGREAGQAVGYLDDGTMVVVERARESIGAEAHVSVTSVLTTANGRMVFARPVGPRAPAHR